MQNQHSWLLESGDFRSHLLQSRTPLPEEELEHRHENPMTAFSVPSQSFLTIYPWWCLPPLSATQPSCTNSNSSSCRCLSQALTYFPSPARRLSRSSRLTSLAALPQCYHSVSSGLTGIWAHPTDSRRQHYLNTYLLVTASSLSDSFF